MPYALSVLGITLAVAALASASFWFEQQRSRERAAVAAHNVVNLLESQIAAEFDKVDVALRSIALSQQEALRERVPETGRMNAFLEQQEALIPELESIGILDKYGKLKFRPRFTQGTPLDLSDREYFIRARADLSGGLHIDGPIFSRITKRWVIVLARPLIDADREFAGLVYASIPTSYFQTVLSGIELGANGAATIRMEDLGLVHRNPMPSDAKVGDRNVSGQLRDIVQAHPEGGEYIARTALDGIERINAYRKVGRYPIYVIVGVATEDYLGDWRRNTFVLSLLTAIVILTSIFTALALYRMSLREADQKRAHSALLRLAATDALTGVANRRCFEETLNIEWRRAIREAQPISLLMVDVDHFKLYNDTHGHQQGDACLKVIAGAIAERALRATDLVARYGGEEFAIILPNTTREGAATIAERIRAAVEWLGLAHVELARFGYVTVSVGAASVLASPERDLARLLAAADAALYEAKHKGRNIVVAVEA